MLNELWRRDSVWSEHMFNDRNFLFASQDSIRVLIQDFIRAKY